MLDTKIFEVRDEGTHITLVAICMQPHRIRMNKAEIYCLRRAGYGWDLRLILCTDAHGSVKAECDPYNWSRAGRSIPHAHSYIQENWDKLQSGDVIDVQFILNETETAKESECSNQ